MTNNDNYILNKKLGLKTKKVSGLKTNKFLGLKINKDTGLKIIKILNYGIAVLLQFMPGIIISYLFDKIYGSFKECEYNEVSTIQIFIELWVHLWLIYITYYITRNLLELIPSPFEGIYGFKNTQVIEVHKATIFFFIVMLFQNNLRTKIQYFRKRLFNE